MNININNFIPNNITPRKSQTKFWQWIENNWDNYDVFVISAPVAAGKSLMSVVVGRWIVGNGGTCAIITPRKIHQDQYTNNFSNIPALKGMSGYICDDCRYNGRSCQLVKAASGHFCDSRLCKYMIARKIAEKSPLVIYNLHSYFSNEIHKNCLIFDEAHAIIDFLRNLLSYKIWKCEAQYEDIKIDVYNIMDLLTQMRQNLLNKISMLHQKNINSYLIDLLEEDEKNISLIHNALSTYPECFVVQKKSDIYYGKIKKLHNTVQEYIYIKAKDIDKFGQNLLWPKDKINKIILSSATINSYDIEMLGLNDKRVGYYHCESEIPSQNRPFIIENIAPMTFNNRNKSIPIIAKRIKEICQLHANQRGIIHATYSVIQSLQQFLSDDPRFIFCNYKDKNQQYQEFISSTQNNNVLIAAGMSDGIDLPGDLARFQIITMLQWPSLEDDVIKWMAQNNKDYYQWLAIRDLIQKYGRIVRSKDDYGITYFLGSELSKTYFFKTQKMWPSWLVNAMIWV